MKKELLIKGEALQASVASALAAEQFLNDHYLFRRNKLNGKVEFSIKPARRAGTCIPSSDSGGAEQHYPSCQA